MDINSIADWDSKLIEALYDAKETGKISDLEEDYNLPIALDLLPDYLPVVLQELFLLSNGMKVYWRSAHDEESGGQLYFLDVKNFLQDGQGITYQPETTGEDEPIRNFKKLDLITSEAQCGLLIDNESVNPELYYNETGYNQLHGLDLDFSGYLEMALAARLYNYWPKVLLDLQSGEESVETSNFKHNMPLVFPEFSWSEFKEKYQSLRLSTK